MKAEGIFATSEGFQGFFYNEMPKIGEMGHKHRLIGKL